MARTVHARQDRVKVCDLAGNERETAEQIYDMIKNDFARMRQFLHLNPRAQLASIERAYVCPGKGTFYVEILNVQHVDVATAAAEAEKFGAEIACIDKMWTLTVRLQTVSVGGWALPMWFVALVMAAIVAAAAFPTQAWHVVRIGSAMAYDGARRLYLRFLHT